VEEPQLAAHAKTITTAEEKVLAALDKDLNTPAALAVLGELGKAGNEVLIFTAKAKKDAAKVAAGRKLARAAIEAMGAAVKPLGLMLAEPRVFFERTRAQRLLTKGLDAAVIDAKVRERTEARAAKDFARGDALRKELTELGVEVTDGVDASSWKVGI
jgi:cysteinyl-tRNA synthetase